MAGRALTITYLADAKSVLAAQGQIDRGHSTLDSSTKRTGGVFSTTFGSLMPIAAAAAGAAVIKFGVDSVKAAIESEQAMAQTEAVIASTGGAANVTAQDIVGLSSRLRDLSGVDDEVIQSSSNLLLTFKNVRNEVGAGNDVFDQAQLAILDMATALNNGAVPSLEDLNGVTKMVGKALNDPIAGLTKLSRAGVDFTEQQKEQITTLVESGDMMGAQKVILEELAFEYGGAAEAAGDTFGGQLAILKSRLGDVQEEIGTALIPVLVQLADVVLALEPAFKAVAVVMQNLPLVQVGEDFAQIRENADGAGVTIGDYADIVLDTIPIVGNFVDIEDHASGQLNLQKGVVGTLADFYKGQYADAMDTASERTKIQTNVTEALTQAQRENRLATLALTDSFLGIISESRNLAEEQRELNRLQRQGKEDTKAYDEQLLEVLESQISLEEAIFSYGKELVDAGKKQRDVERELRDAANAANLNKGAVNELIERIRELIRESEQYDGSTYSATFTGTFDPPGVPGRALQHGGIVTRPTVALIGEAGPEAVIPLNRARGFGVGAAVVNIYVEGSVVAARDLALEVRDELVSLSRRNDGVGF